MKLPSASFLALALALPGAARAAETLGVLAVAPQPGPTPELVEATVQLRQQMAGRNPGEVLDARQLRDRMTGEAGGASLAELDRAYEGARSAAVSGDYEGSTKTLRAIVEELEKLPDSDEGFQQWTRAMTRLAKTEADLGHGDAARGVIDRLLRAAPDLKIDTALYPPKFTRQVEEARDQLKALPKHKLTVTSAAKGVKVFVNGRGVGPAPVTVSLARGRYRVSGAVEALRAPAAQVELADEDQLLAIDFTVPEALRPTRGPGLALPDADRSRRIVTAGGFLGLDAILATSFADEGGVSYLVGSLYDVRRGMLKLEGRVRLGANRSVPSGGVGALAEFLVTGQPNRLVEGPPAVAAKPPLKLDPQTTPEKKLDLTPGQPAPSKTKGWIAFGSGIAAVGLGGVAIWQGLASRSAYDDARAMLDSAGRPLPGFDASAYNKKVRDGDSAKNLALGTGIGSGVCLVTGGVLGYLAYKQTGEIGPFRF